MECLLGDEIEKESPSMSEKNVICTRAVGDDERENKSGRM